LSQTRDHSVPQALADAGEIDPTEVRGHPDRAVLLRTVGHPEGVQPTVSPAPVPLESGDALLICTDGFWELVTETAMAVDLAKSATPDEWLTRLEIRLLARARPGHDNYTAMALLVGPDHGHTGAGAMPGRRL
jgi:serine/threonine protein phosphatase PrpC